MGRRDSAAAFPHLKVGRYEFNKVILRKIFGPAVDEETGEGVENKEK